ncbi:MAG TPA: glycosyl hydrolase [Burkholderiaceae bacterium]|nr:glycosyl hydrolase [Burkholderiaceae bacterium]
MLNPLRALPIGALVLAMGSVLPGVIEAAASVDLTHVHGLAYGANGRWLIIASHHGLAIYSDGRWFEPKGPAHDLMSLSPVRDALYSSGHPAAGSDLTDPVGLIKSTDGGGSWRSLALEGESDFHTVAASRDTNVVYIANRQANSRMQRTGIHYTTDDGAHWRRAAARGLGGPIHQLAVHPTDPNVVAAAGDAGLFLSRDWADTFERLGEPGYVLAVSFDVDGATLWHSRYDDDKPWLFTLHTTPGAALGMVTLPLPAHDAVAHIALNPASPGEVAIATFRRSVFVSRDLGRTWTQIAFEGVTRE